MHLHSRRKEFVARQKHFAPCSVALSLLVVVLALGLDWIVAVLLTIATRRNLRYAQMDSSSFQEWKFPYEILIVALITLPMAFLLFVHVYVVDVMLSVLLDAAILKLTRDTDSTMNSPLRAVRGLERNLLSDTRHKKVSMRSQRRKKPP